ncbi:hypothetical protein [Micromonospora sp. CPCC 205561]|uniref:hypothetical protein n=1 Tax=Micromonospora sp. CPCC 205561 TaxID=3122407 RepID=UPI003FA608AD
MGRWPSDLAEIAVPVDVRYGEQDTRHSPGNGATLAAPLAGALVPQIVGAVRWTRAEPILRAPIDR